MDLISTSVLSGADVEAGWPAGVIFLVLAAACGRRFGMISINQMPMIPTAAFIGPAGARIKSCTNDETIIEWPSAVARWKPAAPQAAR